MARAYYTLLTLDDGNWSQQFGDYDRDVVEQERLDTYLTRFRGDDERYPAKFIKIIRTVNAKQATINATVANLNEQGV